MARCERCRGEHGIVDGLCGDCAARAACPICSAPRHPDLVKADRLLAHARDREDLARSMQDYSAGDLFRREADALRVEAQLHIARAMDDITRRTTQP